MLDPARTASRTKKKKKTTSSPLIGAPAQSQGAKAARVREMEGQRGEALEGARPQHPVHLHAGLQDRRRHRVRLTDGLLQFPGVFGGTASE